MTAAIEALRQRVLIGGDDHLQQRQPFGIAQHREIGLADALKILARHGARGLDGSDFVFIGINHAPPPTHGMHAAHGADKARRAGLAPRIEPTKAARSAQATRSTSHMNLTAVISVYWPMGRTWIAMGRRR
jgi:hypothetical protein